MVATKVLDNMTSEEIRNLVGLQALPEQEEQPELTEEEQEELAADEELLKFESFNDYPAAASNNAKRAIKYKEENGSTCGTPVGWTRARQLADKKPISRATIARMASFKRHQQNKDVPYDKGCGGIMWDAWGGSAGVNWAIRKLKAIDKK